MGGKSKYPQLRDKEWLEHECDTLGKTDVEIAGELGCDASTVRWARVQHEIPSKRETELRFPSAPSPRRPHNISQETGYLWKLTINYHELSGQNQLPLSDKEATTFIVNEINAFAVRICKSETPHDTPSYRYSKIWLLATHIQCHDAAFTIAHARQSKKSSWEK